MKSYIKTIAIIIALFVGGNWVNAQDGESLFKAKCNACHMVDKNSTGPLLKGVLKKWQDAGEGELIYEWVKNPEKLITAGNSTMATAIKDFSPTMMTPQELSNEEVDAVLGYIDNYVKPVDPVATPTPGASVSAVTFVPNYKSNLNLFYFLLTTMVFIFLAIYLMANSIKTLINSDAIKNKLMEKSSESGNGLKNVLMLIGMFGLLAYTNTASAFTYNGPGMAQEGQPWLLIENSDIYALLTVNVVLLGVLWYLRNLFKEFMQMIIPEKAAEVKKAFAFKKLNKVLTDVVEIEDEQSILMDHEYDGIRELDNNLPPWWVWMFYATIIFAVVYIFNYHIIGSADLQLKAYDKEMAQSKKDIDVYLSKMAMNVDETNATLMTDAKDIAAGKGIFEINCISCHNPKGEGNIGPNLTDKFWIYGNDVKVLFKTIKLGTANGMPEHASKLNPIQIQQAASYVLSLPYTKGKEPQGTEVK
ncbi:MAG: cbb3-type cytochrome c oxidase N-terminal domain-containing protein [Crocinitomicaceae bacterium]